MDLHQIEIFYNVVKFRSFSEAAKALYLAQPTVSSHIKNLEAEIGVPLIDRIGRLVVPTETGEVLFQAGQKFLSLRDQTWQDMKALSGSVTGMLKIGASAIPGAYILPSLIRAFKKQHPDTSIHLEVNDSAQVTESC